MSTQNKHEKQWDDELNQEVSSIKPDLGIQQQERKEPRFTYSTPLVAHLRNTLSSKVSTYSSPKLKTDR